MRRYTPELARASSFAHFTKAHRQLLAESY
eukprot:COSAG03_NODE_9922_length_685_cov_5.082908_1_plen_29_part_10